MQPPSRRDFLRSTLCGGAALGLPADTRVDTRIDPGADTRIDPRADTRVDPRAASRPAPGRAPRPLKLLILGGTGFLGPHTIEAALARGHAMTLFNRGRTNEDLFPDLEKLRGDRDPRRGAGLRALEGRRWDAVIDTSGYVPRVVKASADLLRDAVDQYVFISSVSAIADTSVPGVDESAPVTTMTDETNEEVTKHYGALKALCERAAETALPGRTTSVRPGLIVGPRDYSDRFTYWPLRIEQGGEVLAPGDHDDPVQYIDARDLAAFIVRTVEERALGIYHATGPTTPTNIAELLYGCKAVTGGTATFTWADAAFLAERGIAPWQEMTVWIPPKDEFAGFHRISIRRAVEAGLASRPLAETVADTLAWYEGLPERRRGNRRAGLDPMREAAALEAWHALHG